ncbi:MAG: hypothetical protein LBR32_02550 [Propionibacteriaceae bacterium]|jgi:hypothetical protein|nr:hypothetical protein [Propionibacteriaceae bacterium]
MADFLDELRDSLRESAESSDFRPLNAYAVARAAARRTPVQRVASWWRRVRASVNGPRLARAGLAFGGVAVVVVVAAPLALRTSAGLSGAAPEVASAPAAGGRFAGGPGLATAADAQAPGSGQVADASSAQAEVAAAAAPWAFTANTQAVWLGDSFMFYDSSCDDCQTVSYDPASDHWATLVWKVGNYSGGKGVDGAYTRPLSPDELTPSPTPSAAGSEDAAAVHASSASSPRSVVTPVDGLLEVAGDGVRITCRVGTTACQVAKG